MRAYLSDLAVALDTGNMASLVEHDLVDGLLEHVRASVDGRETSKRLKYRVSDLGKETRNK